MNKDSFLVPRDGSCLKEHRLLGITDMELYHRTNYHFTAVGRARKSLYAPGMCESNGKLNCRAE